PTLGGTTFGADPNLVAQSSLINSGTIGGRTNVNISSPFVFNTGHIVAQSGNVNFSSPSSFAMSGAGGTVSAAQNINITSANSNIAINQNSFFSQQLNFSAGTGSINAQMETVTGLVNASGYCIAVGANTSALNLGKISASGDPTFTNSGSILINN